MAGLLAKVSYSELLYLKVDIDNQIERLRSERDAIAKTIKILERENAAEHKRGRAYTDPEIEADSKS